MISKTLQIITSGLNQLRLNVHYLLVAVLLIILPGVFIWVAQKSFEFTYQNINTVEKQSVSLLHESIELNLTGQTNPQIMQNYLVGLVNNENNISKARVLKQSASELVIVQSADSADVGFVEGASELYVSSASVPGDSLIYDFTIDGSRTWQAFRQVRIDNEIYYIFTEHSFAKTDSVILARHQQLYLALPIIFLFLMFLAYWLLQQTNWHKKYALVRQKLDDQMMFTNTIAHELRAPLTAIRGYNSFLLESQNLTNDEKMYSNNINTSAKRLIALINDFLAVARIQSGNLKVKFTEIDVRKVLSNVSSEFNKTAAEKGIEFSLNLPPNPIFVETDADRLQQVLTNLVSNSLKYTDKGSVAISLEQTRLKTVITIKDTGHGISASDQKKLFTPFMRVGTADQGGETGTGLGMWITKQLVELLHGTVSVESIEGVGTHVKLTFDV